MKNEWTKIRREWWNAQKMDKRKIERKERWNMTGSVEKRVKRKKR